MSPAFTDVLATRFCAPEPGGGAGTGHGTDSVLPGGAEAASLVALDAGGTAVAGAGGAVVGEGPASAMITDLAGEGVAGAVLADLAGPPHPASVAIAQTAIAATALQAAAWQCSREPAPMRTP